MSMLWLLPVLLLLLTIGASLLVLQWLATVGKDSRDDQRPENDAAKTAAPRPENWTAR